ncbi:MAG: GNAT family N-acetyltransferase [Boseongicola sp.]|nr:MAG: GNAT family N-acetyltransferase [Boseongicola sp.]
MIIRPSRVGDADAVGEIINLIVRDTTISFRTQELTDKEILERISGSACMFVAEDQGSVVGYASYDQFRRGAGYNQTMEHSIAVLPRARGQGIGPALMQKIEDHARDAGIASMWAGVSGENAEGVTFHTRLGYEFVAVLPSVGFKFGRWIDLTLLRKWLLPEGDAPEQAD